MCPQKLGRTSRRGQHLTIAFAQVRRKGSGLQLGCLGLGLAWLWSDCVPLRQTLAVWT